MYLKKLKISNFRIFQSNNTFTIDDINFPDGENEGTGLTIFIGENGLGKTTILDSIALTLLEYKSDQFSVQDINDISENVLIESFSSEPFSVKGTMPRIEFGALGFQFKGSIRRQSSKNYLQSSVVSDQTFIKENPRKPKDGSPDLRLAVNNPFSGKRFSENDILYLEKNRSFQIRQGSYNPTRFDRLMKDFDFQYLKKEDKNNMNFALDNEFKRQEGSHIVENTFLVDAITTFERVSGSRLTLDFIENQAPFKTAFFAERKNGDRQIKLSEMGSGYEIIFSIIYSYYLSKQSGKQLILMIDEPELHLHPKLQQDLVTMLLEFSKDSQIIITSHSPLLVKNLFENDKVKFKILAKNSGVVEICNPEERKLPYLSANEVNFIAFRLASEEYHNELYEYSKINFETDDATLNIKQFDTDYFIEKHNEEKISPWCG